MDFEICKKCNKKLPIDQFSKCGIEIKNICKKCEKFFKIKKRFEEKVVKSDGCWSFKSPINRKGYHVMRSFNGKADKVHRIAWILYKGPIPAKIFVRHTCSNNGCCNPDHLYLMHREKFSSSTFWKDATPEQKLERNKKIFYRRVIKGKSENDCWHFSGRKGSDGYSIVKFNNKKHRAHRVSWIIHNGLIPKGMIICHTCDKPECVNPSHLFLGSHADNSNDMVKKGRSAKGSQCGNSSIDEEDAFKIKEFLRIGLSPLEIETMIGVSKFIIRNIKNGKSWKHVKI